MSGKVQGLNREFAKKDVERMRNLLQGKYGEKTQTSVGFTKSDKKYEEGDIWEADGRTWTIKDGVKQNITKLDKAKKVHMMPLFCPSCKKIMNNEIDNKIVDFKAWVEDKMSESNNQYVSEAGDVENWKGKINKEKVQENVDAVVEYLEGLKK